MPKPSPKTIDRVKKELKKYQSLLLIAASRDINETDTVTIIRDILADVFGYDKYNDITAEYAIRGTFCDLAIRIDGKVYFIIEIKAPGIDLSEKHIRQAINYASNEGVEWVILTNGLAWQVYKVHFKQPVVHELIFTFNLPSMDIKDEKTLEMLFLLTKEGLAKSAIDEYQLCYKATNRFAITATLLDDSVIRVIRKELRLANPRVKIDPERIKDILKNEIVKRDIIEDSRFYKEEKRTLRKGRRKSSAQSLIESENASMNADDRRDISKNNIVADEVPD